MKNFLKTVLIFIITAVFLSACGKNPEIEKPSNIKVIKDCVYQSGGLYGVIHGDELVTEAVYETYKQAKIGDFIIYVFGRTDGTKPMIEYDEEGKPSEITETKRVLYDFYFSDGTRFIEITADDYEYYGSFFNVSRDGNIYEYSISAEGEVKEEYVFTAGTERLENGYSIVSYYYGASRLSIGAGVLDSDGNEIIPKVYTTVGIYFGDRIVAQKMDGFGLSEIGRIYDLEGNVICEKYNRIEFFEFDNDEWLGVAVSAGPMSQVATVFYDEYGNEIPKGIRFINKDGKEVSPIFESGIDFGKPYYSADSVITVTDSEGNSFDLKIGDYTFFGGKTSDFSDEMELVTNVAYRQNGKYGFHNGGVPVTEAIYDEIVPIHKVGDDEVYVNTYEVAKKDMADLFVGIYTDGTRETIDFSNWQSIKTIKKTNTLYSIYQAGSDSLINDIPFMNFNLNAPNSWGNSLHVVLLSGTNGGDRYDYIPTENGWKLYQMQSGGVYNAYSEKCYFTKYYWSPSALRYGLIKPDDSVILEPVYHKIDMVPHMFILAYDGYSSQTMDDVNCTYMYDFDGNLICAYDYIKYEFVQSGRFVILAMDTDDNGDTHWWFIDETGKKLSESYNLITINYDEDSKGNLNKKTATVYADTELFNPDAKTEEIPIKDYVIYVK